MAGTSFKGYTDGRTDIQGIGGTSHHSLDEGKKSKTEWILRTFDHPLDEEKKKKGIGGPSHHSLDEGKKSKTEWIGGPSHHSLDEGKKSKTEYEEKKKKGMLKRIGPPLDEEKKKKRMLRTFDQNLDEEKEMKRMLKRTGPHLDEEKKRKGVLRRFDQLLNKEKKMKRMLKRIGPPPLDEEKKKKHCQTFDHTLRGLTSLNISLWNEFVQGIRRTSHHTLDEGKKSKTQLLGGNINHPMGEEKKKHGDEEDEIQGTSGLEMDYLQEGAVQKEYLPDNQKPMSRQDISETEILRSQSLPIIELSFPVLEIDVSQEGDVQKESLPDNQKPMSRDDVSETEILPSQSLPIFDFGTLEKEMDVLQERTVRKGNLPDHQKPLSRHDILETEILRSQSLPIIELSSSDEKMDYLQEAVVLEENLTDDKKQMLGHDGLKTNILHARPTPKLDFGTSERERGVLQEGAVQKENLPDHQKPMSNEDILEKAKSNFKSTNLILAKDSNKEKERSYSEDKGLETVIIGFSEECYISEIWKTEFHGFKVYLKHPLNVNSDTTNTSILKREEDKPVSEYDEDLIVKYIGANDLWDSHSNLRIITCDSYKYTAGNIIEKTCLVLYCRWKGFIPLGENSFPKFINCGEEKIDVDVREGYFQNGVLRGVPFAYNDPICMGSCISELNSDKTGSIGLFVQSHDKKSVGFLTCSHVLLDCTHHSKYDLPANEIKHVIQPSKSTFLSDSSITFTRFCGKIEDAKFHCNVPKSVDVALVKVTERMPNTGHFVVRDGFQVSDAGFNEESFPQYHGQVMRNIPKTERYRPCFKSGTATGFTRGQLKLRKMEVYIEDNGILLGDSNSDGKRIMKGQYEVSTATSSPFFSPGDSGAAVFLYDTESKLNCIGIAIGTSSYGSTIVTPIGNVLDSLGLTDANVVSFPPTEDNKDNA